MNTLEKPIQYLKGVGEAKSKLFHKLNLFTVEDIIYHFPRDYEDRSDKKKIEQLLDGESCTFEGIVFSRVQETEIRKGLVIYKLIVKDETASVVLTWFNNKFIKNTFVVGEKYLFFGKINRKFGKTEVVDPIFERANSNNLRHTCQIIPLYPSTGGLSQKVIQDVVRNALDSIDAKLEEILPQYIREGHNLAEINYAIQNIHFPNTLDGFEHARRRLVFEEFLILQLGLLRIKDSIGEQADGLSLKVMPQLQELIETLPFELTGDQTKVLDEIMKDIHGPKPMNRLVQGDVGSGKTIVAVVALFNAVLNGYQGALMAPTEILAEQHYKSTKSLLEKFGIKIGLLVGSLAKKQKEQLLEEIKEGRVDIVIGTHALIEDKVLFDKLGLVITDEQHRFGVRQRSTLSSKGINPHVLVMTATPIPRTLALILYGDLDISIIKEMPPGRKKIETYAVDNSMRDRINLFIKKEVSAGRQAYVVCPLVEDSEAITAKSVVEHAEKLQQDFSEFNISYLHGKMKPKEKEEIMRNFRDCKIDILVSTTVIEVGVNVPNASVMVIENAERFGLAQLHQLRGRVGRGEYQSYCILFNEGDSKVSKERAKIMAKTNDGFEISEKDLEIRGPGEFFGIRQHGLPDLKIANLFKDMDILKEAQVLCFKILKLDKELRNPEHRLIRNVINQKFAQIGGENTFAL